MLYLKYIMLTSKRKPITLATKNVTLSAKLFFLTMKPYKKMPLNPYKLLDSMPITVTHQMLHQCNIFKENFPETGELNASETLILIVNSNFTFVFHGETVYCLLATHGTPTPVKTSVKPP